MNRRIEPVTQENLALAAGIHARSWQQSHRAFCSPAFVSAHTPEAQQEMMKRRMDEGARFFLLYADDTPAAVVSLCEDLIENLYVEPALQRCGHGTALLSFAMARCSGAPRLWILDNNEDAARLYERFGFSPTGKRHFLSDTLSEVEYKKE